MNEIILKEREVKEKIVEIINGSELPALILKSMIKDILEQLEKLEQQQYEIAKESVNNKEKEEK